MPEPIAIDADPTIEEIQVNVSPDDAIVVDVATLSAEPISVNVVPAQTIEVTNDDGDTITIADTPLPNIEVVIGEPEAALVVTVPSVYASGGTPSGGGGSFRFVQATPLATWTIVHPLGYRPAVSIEDNTGEVVIGDLTYPDVNTVIANFSVPLSGAANLS